MTATVRVISGTYGHVVSLIKVNVFPQRLVVHRVLRYFEAEQSVMKKTIRLLRRANADGQVSEKFVRCVERMDENFQNRVALEWDTSNRMDSSCSITIRYKCPTYPSEGIFYVLIYDDSTYIALSEVLRLFLFRENVMMLTI